MKPYNKILKDHKLEDKDIAEMFGYKNTVSFKNSSARGRYEKGLERFYNRVKN